MADILADVIRLQVDTEASLFGASPPPVKLKQFVHALDTGNVFYKNSLGVFIKFTNAALYTSQSSGQGSNLIGDQGIPGITPSGGSIGSPATVHDMMIGLRDYTQTIVYTIALVDLFPTWDEGASYSQNDVVTYDTGGGFALAISNIPGDGTNTGNDPNDLENDSWGRYTGTFPLASVITMILNTKANA